jgi:hypothetical protein
MTGTCHSLFIERLRLRLPSLPETNAPGLRGWFLVQGILKGLRSEMPSSPTRRSWAFFRKWRHRLPLKIWKQLTNGLRGCF